MCHKFDCEIAATSFQQGENLESSFTNYIDSMMKIREAKVAIDTKTLNVQKVREEMHWFVITGGDKEIVENHYQPIIEEHDIELESLQKDLEQLESNTNLAKGLYFNFHIKFICKKKGGA